jgi:hypothetical protein
MRTSSVALLFALSWAGVQADGIGDAVPGHPGATYVALLKQAVPGLVKDKTGNWNATANLHGTDGKVTSVDLSFNSVEALTIDDGGRKRLILLTGNSQTNGSFSAILAAYDDTTRKARLLDVMDGGGDRFVSFSTPRTLKIAAESDAFLVNVNHFNSSQGYTEETIYYLDRGRLKVALPQFTLNEAGCGYEMRQVPTYTVLNEKAARFRPISVSVTQTVTHTDETCDAGTKIPKAGKNTYTDIFRFDNVKNAYAAHTNALSHLMKPDE